MSAERRTTDIESATHAVAYLGEQYWHDSVLHEVSLVRTRSTDHVVLKLDLLSDGEKWVSQPVELVFRGCRHVRAQMNWGIQCMSTGEMVDTAEASDTDPCIEQVKATWKKIDMELGDLAVFRMELASTGSTLEVVFSGITVKHFGEAGPHQAPPPLAPSGSN